MAEREIRIRVLGDSKDYDRMMDRLGKKTSGLSRSLKTLGKVGIPIVGGALAGMAVVVKNGFDELSEMQKVGQQTNATLKSTGAVANVTAKHVGNLANSLSRMSGIDDELIQRGENLLLTFKNVRNETGKGNKVFDRATKAALNLSVAGFGSVESASKMMGKALNDPVKGMTALSRAGVTFTEEQKETIKQLVKSNDLLGAQRIILREVESQVGGSAKAYGDTFPGQLKKLSNAFDGVTAALAKGMLPIVRKVAAALTEKFADPAFMARVEKFGKLVAEKLVNAFVAIGRWFKENWPAIKRGFQVVTDIVKALVEAMREVVQQYNEIRHPLRAHKVDPRKMTREQYDALPGWVKEAYEERGGKVPPKGPVRSRQLGGHMSAGVPHRMHEGEIVTLGSSGHATPNGGVRGVLVTGDIIFTVDKHVLGRITLEQLERMARSTSASRSGRFGGASFATG